MGGRLDRLLDSLAEQTVAHETIVIDNASPGGSVSATGGRYDFAEVVRLDHNAGFSMPMNVGARRASTETLVLLNDDCVCDPEFIERLIEPLDPGAGVVMASGVLRDWRHPELIDSAGMELDRTLLVYDYLNGEPVEALAAAADPIAPSPKAASLRPLGLPRRRRLRRAAVRVLGGRRPRAADARGGGTCRLAPGALGVHEHSATLGSGSRAKNYLTGFGRGYVLRKWGVVSPRRLPGILARDLVVVAGQAAIDRTVSGIGGRIKGWRAAGRVEEHPYPAAIAARGGGSPYLRNLQRRLQRRRKLAAPGPG